MHSRHHVYKINFMSSPYCYLISCTLLKANGLGKSSNDIDLYEYAVSFSIWFYLILHFFFLSSSPFASSTPSLDLLLNPSLDLLLKNSEKKWILMKDFPSRCCWPHIHSNHCYWVRRIRALWCENWYWKPGNCCFLSHLRFFA